MKAITYISQDWRTSIPQEECQKYGSEFIKTNSQRSCGIACILMALEYFKVPVPSISELFHKALDYNAFSQIGLIHNKAVKLIESYGLNAKPIQVNHTDIASFINNKDTLFIASVGHLFAHGKSQGHLVLLSEKIQQNKEEGFLINDPSPFSQKQYFINMQQFATHYSNRGIIINL